MLLYIKSNLIQWVDMKQLFNSSVKFCSKTVHDDSGQHAFMGRKSLISASPFTNWGIAGMGMRYYWFITDNGHGQEEVKKQLWMFQEGMIKTDFENWTLVWLEDKGDPVFAVRLGGICLPPWDFSFQGTCYAVC